MGLDLETIHSQIQNLEIQKNNALTTFQQCTGAIAVLQEQLSLIKKKEEIALKALEGQGDNNGEDVDQGSD